MNEPKRKPWMKWYPGDWRGDEALRQCGFAARGLWADLLTLMHKAEPYGHLLVNGRMPTAQQLAQMLGGTAREIARLMGELDVTGVYSKTDDGVPFSRRMVRDNRREEEDRDNGHLGGHPGIRRGTVPKDDRVRRFRKSDNPAMAARVFARNGGKCHWCRKPLDDSYHIDHVKAVADGGTNAEDNLVAACPDCNGQRAMTAEWNRVGRTSDPNPGVAPDHKAQMLEARSQKPDDLPSGRTNLVNGHAVPEICRGFTLDDLDLTIREILDAMDVSIASYPAVQAAIWGWFEAGCHPEDDVRDAIRDAKRRGSKPNGNPLPYWQKVVFGARDARLRRAA